MIALIGAAIAACLFTAVEAYVLLGRQRRQQEAMTQFLEAARLLLAAVPGKSAPRTDTAPVPVFHGATASGRHAEREGA